MVRRKHLVFCGTRPSRSPALSGAERIRVHHEAMPEVVGTGSSSRSAVSELPRLLTSQLDCVVGWRRDILVRLIVDVRRLALPPAPSL